MKSPLQQLAADPEVVAALAAVARVVPPVKRRCHALPVEKRAYRCKYKEVKPTIENLLMRMSLVEEEAEERKERIARLSYQLAHLEAEVTRLRGPWKPDGHEGTQRTQK